MLPGDCWSLSEDTALQHGGSGMQNNMDILNGRFDPITAALYDGDSRVDLPVE